MLNPGVVVARPARNSATSTSRRYARVFSSLSYSATRAGRGDARPSARALAVATMHVRRTYGARSTAYVRSSTRDPRKNFACSPEFTTLRGDINETPGSRPDANPTEPRRT